MQPLSVSKAVAARYTMLFLYIVALLLSVLAATQDSCEYSLSPLAGLQSLTGDCACGSETCYSNELCYVSPRDESIAFEDFDVSDFI